MNHSFRVMRLAISTTAVVILAGCAQQLIRDDATAKLQEGKFEAAVQGLQAGVAKYPDSAMLRAGLLSTRNDAVARLIAEASQQRSAGKFEEAGKTLQRALTLDPQNDRALSLQRDLDLERLTEKRLEEARAASAAGDKARALRLVEDALRDAPRYPALLSLRRQLSAQQRFEARSSGGFSLAETRPISIDFRAAPLSTVLEAITRGSGINFVLDRDVRRDAQVTIYLRSATVEEALDLVTGSYQLSRRIIDPQTVLIYPNTPDKQKEHREEVVRVFHLANADAKATATLLKSMLRIKDPFVDERANMIALRDSPEVIALAERLVGLHDVGDPEVMLEVEILEIRTSRLTELGINFPSSFSLTPLNASGGTGLTVADFRDINSGRIGVTVPNLLVNLRREVGDVNILANPRIRTKNREKAHILIGDKVPVVTSTLTSTGFVSESVSYLDVGLKLDVEPVISPDDEVTIKLALEVSSIANTIRTAGGSTVYQIGTRNANTALRLRDGETQLLAGLISREDRSTANRVPGLGDLPVAGRLFSSQKDDGQRTELVLAITPRIVHPATRPDVGLAEMWVGSETSTRLRPAPSLRAQNGGSAEKTAGEAPGAARSPGQVPERSGGSGTRLAGAVPADMVGAPATVRVSWHAPPEIAVGEVFDVRLDLATNAALRSVPLEVRFAAEAVEVVAVTEGTLFRQGGTVASFTHAVGPGRVSAGVLSSDANGVRGSGSLMQLRLKAKKAGLVELNLSSFVPSSSDGQISVGEMPVLKVQAK